MDGGPISLLLEPDVQFEGVNPGLVHIEGFLAVEYFVAPAEFAL